MSDEALVEKVAQAIRAAQEAGWDENPLYGCARAALSVIEAPDYPAATRSLVAAVKAQVKAERERDEARAEAARLTVEKLTYLDEYRRYREATEADMALMQARHDDALAALADLTDPGPAS